MSSAVLALGLVCWIVTAILVESDLFRPLREWLEFEADTWQQVRDMGDEDSSFRYKRDVPLEVFFRKAKYLVACHLCAGTWVALLLAALIDVRPFGHGFLGWLLAGLVVKAVAHLTLVLQKAGERLAA